MKDITEVQRKILKQFKLNLEDILKENHTDDVLIKFLRMKNFNLKGAEKIFRTNYYNRIMFGINTILDTYEKPEVLKQYESFGILGFAKDGSIIQYAAAGRVDFYGFIMSASCLDLCLYFSHMMEYVRKLLADENLKTGNNVKEITYVFDLEGFSIQQVLHKCVIELGMDFTRLVQDCYPEAWSMILVVNAPAIFDKVFNIFKPVVATHLFDKIKVAGKDSTTELLLQYIDEDILPAFLGGKKVDSKGDPECKEFISFGGKIPENFYAINRSPLSSLSGPGVNEITLGPRCCYNHIEIVKEGTMEVRCQMRSENGSVICVVYYREFGPDQNGIQLLGPHESLHENDENCKYRPLCVAIRDQAHCTPDDVTITLPWPGIYVYRFSNPSRFFGTRKIFYRATNFPQDFEILTPAARNGI